MAAILEEDKSRLGTKNAGADVVSRWLPNTPDGNQIATGIAQRNVARFSQVPVEVSFEVDSAYIGAVSGGRMWLGSVFAVETISEVYCNGAFEPEVLICQCTSIVAASKADKWRITGISYKANVPPNADYYIAAGEYFNYILSDNFDFSEAREYTVVISSGAIFGSTSESWASFRQGAFASGATLRIINQGQFIGIGGVGGSGATPEWDPELVACLDVVGNFGSLGGAGCEFTTDVIIDNTFGLIAGGGQGGKGGNGRCLSPTVIYPGAGGGGGQGFAGGLGGVAGSGSVSSGAGFAGDKNYAGAGGIGYTTLENGYAGFGLGSAPAIITNGNTVTITGGNNAEQVRGAIV